MPSKHNFTELPAKTFFLSPQLHQQLIGNGICGTEQVRFVKLNDFQFSVYYTNGTLIGQFDIPDYMASDGAIINWHNCPMYQNGDLMAVGDRLVASVRSYLVVGSIEKINLEQDNMTRLTVGGVRIRESRNNKAWTYNRDYYAHRVKEALKLPI